MEIVNERTIKLQKEANRLYPQHKFTVVCLNDNYLIDTYKFIVNGDHEIEMSFLGDPFHVESHFHKELENSIKLIGLSKLSNKI